MQSRAINPRHRRAIITAIFSALTAVLLAPAFIGTLVSDRWVHWLLAALSLLILYPLLKEGRISRRKLYPLMISAGLVGAMTGLLFGIDKVLLVGGLLLFAALFLGERGNISPSRLLSLGVILALLVPLPAPLQAELQSLLLSAELHGASDFLTFFGTSAYVAGLDLAIDGRLVKLTLDCSASGLIVPLIMGTATVIGIRSPSCQLAVAAVAGAIVGGILLNFVRLITLALLAPEASNTLFMAAHDILGLLVMGIIWSLPFWVSSTVCRFSPRLWGAVKHWRVPALVSSLCAGIVASIITLAPQPSGGEQAPHLPSYQSGWVSMVLDIDPDEARLLRADRIERRRFQLDPGTEILATLIHHKDPIRARQHSSLICYQTLGWRIAGIKRSTFQSYDTIQFRAETSRRKQWVIEVRSATPEAGVTRLQLVGRSPKLLQQFLASAAGSILPPAGQEQST